MESDLGLTQRALAQKAGITTAHLSNLEAGRTNPTWGTMRKIAGALEI
jgi:transcriptional regulator with XRE-family HTH domain